MEHITITYQRERVGDGRRRGRPRGREGLFLSDQEGRGRFNNEITCSSRSYSWPSDRDLWRAGAPSLPRFASPLQPKTTFPKISERTLWALLGAAGGLLAAEPGGVGARGSRIHSVRDTRPPESTAAFSRCAFRALSVPSDRNRSPRGASAGQVSWRERLGRGGGGVRAVGGDPSGH